MFSCEIILSMLNFCSVTQKCVMVFLPLVYKKNLLAEGKTHLIKVLIKFGWCYQAVHYLLCRNVMTNFMLLVFKMLI